MEKLTIIQLIAVWILPILFAVTFHEAAHGYIAHKLGDDTAFLQGRISANPLKHIDPIGTVVVPIILLISSGFVFGWAKPVPVNPNRLRNPKRDFALVALAGPTSNFLMAVFWMGILKIALMLPKSEMVIPLAYMCQAGISINLVLMVLNLIPIPPLDGSRFVSYLLPRPWDLYFDKITPFGFLIVLALIISGYLTKIMSPALTFLQQFLFMIFKIH